MTSGVRYCNRCGVLFHDGFVGPNGLCKRCMPRRCMLALVLLALGCGGFDAGPVACQFKGDYLITATSLDPDTCASWTMDRHYAGSFAFGCSPELGIAGYSGNVSCTDDTSGVALSCTGQLSGDGCWYELTVERN